MREQKTNIAVFTWEKEGYLKVVMMDNNHEFDLEEAKRQIEVGTEIASGQKVPALIDLSKSRHVPSMAAKRYIAKNCHLKSAEALVLNSLANRIIGNFYFKMIDNKDYPRRIFSDKEKALEWLQKYFIKDFNPNEVKSVEVFDLTL